MSDGSTPRPRKSLQFLLVDCGSSYCSRLEESISSLGTIRRIPLAEANTADLSGDALVLSGGPCFYSDCGELNQAYIDQFAFLAEERRPVLGICMGHQGMALRFGARIFTGQRRSVDETILLTADAAGCPLFHGITPPVQFAERHTEGITLPDDFTLLGYSRYYPVEAMVHRSRPLYGVQFHPEISGPAGQRMLANFAAIAANFP